MTAPAGDPPTALITGVSRRAGIASAVALGMARAGWHLALTGWPAFDRNMPWGDDPAGLDLLVKDLEAVTEGRVFFVAADLSTPGAPESVFDHAEGALGPITALINVHAHSTRGGLLELSEEELDRHLSVNVRGTLMMCAEYARRWSGHPGEGRIVNFISSLPLKGEIAYAASKGAIEWATVAIAGDLADKGITVNAINPGPTQTGWMDADLVGRIREAAPLGRIGTPDDVSALVVFLCSSRAGWITGQVLHCDGGWKHLRT